MDVNVILTDLRDEPLIKMEHHCPNCNESFGRKTDVTFQDATISALINGTSKPEDKVARYKLGQKLAATNGDLSLEKAEKDLLINCIKENSPIIITGRLMEILDG